VILLAEREKVDVGRFEGEVVPKEKVVITIDDLHPRERSEILLRESILRRFTWTFIVSLGVTFTLCFLNGFGVTGLDNKVLLALIGATAGEFASLILVGFKYLFRF